MRPKIAAVTAMLLVHAGPLQCQPGERSPLDDVRALLDSIAHTAVEVRAINREAEALEPRGRDWFQRRQAHDAVRCTYRDGHPEDCAAYDAEAERLNAEAGELRQALARVEHRRDEVNARYASFQRRLSMLQFFGRYEDWGARVVACSRLAQVDAAAGCLNLEWERHP